MAKKKPKKAKPEKAEETVKVNLKRDYRVNRTGKVYGPGRDVEVPKDSTIASFGVKAEDMPTDENPHDAAG